MKMRDLEESDETRTRADRSADAHGSSSEPGDRLTIRRMLLLIAGVALGLVIFAPNFDDGDLQNVEKWRYTANAIIIGMAIPAPLFCIGRVIRNRPLAAGGLFALAAGLGVWLLLPAAVAECLARHAGINRGTTVSCLYWVLPLMGLWYFLAALVSGHVSRELFRAATSWTERYGLFLALAWSPLGVWMLVDIYREALG